jgi:hypothetical protein
MHDTYLIAYYKQDSNIYYIIHNSSNIMISWYFIHCMTVYSTKWPCILGDLISSNAGLDIIIHIFYTKWLQE